MFTLLFALAHGGEPPAVLEARTLWGAAQEGKKDELYVHRARLNAGNRSWPAVGTFARSIDAWVRVRGGLPAEVVLVEVDDTSAAIHSEIDVLYEPSGSARFVLLQGLRDEPIRLYFDAAGTPVRLQIGTTPIDRLDVDQLAFARRILELTRRLHGDAQRLSTAFEPALGPADLPTP